MDSDFDAGCPVLAVSVEEPPADGEPLAIVAAAEVFTTWETLLADALRSHGAAGDEAAQVATLIVAAVDGTVAMCRAKRSTGPLDAVTAQLERLVAATVSR